MSRSRSPERRSPVSSWFGRSASQRCLPSPHNPSQVQQRFGRQDKVVEDRVHEDLQKLARSSPQAYGNDEARSRSTHSNSPARPLYTGNSRNSYDNHNQSLRAYRTDGWDSERRGSHMQSGLNFEYPVSAQTLEELELECKREAMELERIRDKEEHEEKYKHHEAVKETRENFIKKLVILRGAQAKQRKEFLRLDAQRRLQQARQEISTLGFGGYGQPCYDGNDNSAGNAHYTGATNIPIDPRVRYPNPMDDYGSTRPRDTYGDFQRQRHGKAYSQY